MRLAHGPALAVAPAVPLTDLTAMTRDTREALDVAWEEVTATSAFVGGELVERFEEQWARYCGTAHAVGVANGTDAIELALRAFGIGMGDEVVVPANSFIATAEAVVAAGATPRFVDVDPGTLLATASTIRPAIGPRTAAVIVVGLYGNVPVMDDVLRLARETGLAVVEDAAQAHGAAWLGRKVGSFGVAGCFSFYPGKNLGAFGDAGAVVTDDAALAERIRSLGNHGRPAGASHVHALLGGNSRLDALQAAVLSAKLPLLDEWNRARRAAVAAYRRLCGPDLGTVQVPYGAEPAWHQHVVRVGRARDLVREGLARRGIATGIHYAVPCHHQEPYRRFAPDRLPVTEAAAAEILSLPLFPHLTERQIDHVARSLDDVMRELGRRDR
jgi:dTDP-4-amino-4,6-dideoxygalactose transaminase